MGTVHSRKSKESSFPAEKTESIADSLVGVIPDPGVTLEELREERLKKYAD